MLHAREEQGKIKNLKCGTEFTEFLGNSVYQFLGDFQTKFTHHGTSPSAHKSLPYLTDLCPHTLTSRARAEDVEQSARFLAPCNRFFTRVADFR
jgi:hypothetical protein